MVSQALYRISNQQSTSDRDKVNQFLPRETRGMPCSQKRLQTFSLGIDYIPLTRTLKLVLVLIRDTCYVAHAQGDLGRNRQRFVGSRIMGTNGAHRLADVRRFSTRVSAIASERHHSTRLEDTTEGEHAKNVLIESRLERLKP